MNTRGGVGSWLFLAPSGALVIAAGLMLFHPRLALVAVAVTFGWSQLLGP